MGCGSPRHLSIYRYRPRHPVLVVVMVVVMMRMSVVVVVLEMVRGRPAPPDYLGQMSGEGILAGPPAACIYPCSVAVCDVGAVPSSEQW